jgi:nucleoside-diphosphate-sugar epimerase
MTILVTGAGGFLGPRIVESLLNAGVTELRLQYRQPPSATHLDSLRRKFPAARIEAVVVNLLARKSLGDLVSGIQCIVHAAAGTKGAVADMFLNTVVATRNLLDAAVAQRVQRIVLISSFSVYRTEGLSRHAVLSETVPVEEVGIEKGAYAYAKTRQEHLVREYQQRHAFDAVILRPGVIYGPGAGPFSPRVGIAALGWFFNLGGSARLPLTYVENCADAIAHAALHAPANDVFNIVDHDLPACGEYLRRYRREVRKIRAIRVPYWLFMLGSRWLASYNRRSQGQLPGVFTPYIVRSMYRPLQYSNAALEALGWRQRVSTRDALAITFQHLRKELTGT